MPGGLAFVQEDEFDALARTLGLSIHEFTHRFLRSVVDPKTVKPRFALRDRHDGACSLLDGDNQCSAYSARPKGCREFPKWLSILEDPRGLKRAIRICPGIEERPSGSTLVDALARLRVILNRIPGLQTCAFPSPGETPHVTGLEFELLLIEAEPGCAHGCPIKGTQQADRTLECRVPGAQPLACRARSRLPTLGSPSSNAEEELESATLERDRLEASLPWPRRFGRVAELLETRRDPNSIELFPKTHP